MRIGFLCSTNKDYVAINTATFRIPGGSTITIDRKETNYSMKGDILEMVWKGCYVHSLNGFNIFPDEPDTDEYREKELRKMLMDSTFVSFELEDDAGEDYFVKKLEWTIE